MSAGRVVIQTPTLPDSALTAEEFGRRHYEAFTNPKHEHHRWATEMFERAVAMDLADKGVSPNGVIDVSGAWEA